MAPVLSSNSTAGKLIFIIAFLACCSPFVSPAIALLTGLVVAQIIKHPFPQFNHKAVQVLLRVCVVGLGFGMNLHSALEAGREGFILTAASVLVTLLLGAVLGKWLKNEKKISHLINCGTAICGGSAITAVSPVIKAREEQISVALGTIFILNSIALFVFPAIGHWLNLSQKQFGLWSAIAIHDTSSVVGAASKYGTEALQVATTVKLARTLWIIPVVIITGFLFKNTSARIKPPYFIVFFAMAMAANTYLPQIAPLSPYLVSAAKTGLTLTLFLIGAGLNADTLKTVGLKPLLQGALLWIFISATVLYAVTWLA